MEGVRLFEDLSKQHDYPYDGTSEIDSDAHNPNLMLTTDHECQDPFERLSWGGMIVYLNAILKLFLITPQNILYFDESHLSPKRWKPGPYFGNPRDKRWGVFSITMDRLRNLMK
jgi:hypothetical protein